MRRQSIEALPHQADLVDDETAEVICLTGGLRAGKTTGMVLKAVRLGAANYPTPTLIVEPTFRMIDDVFVRTARALFQKHGIPYRHRKHDKSFDVTIGGKTLEFMLRSAEDPERLQGFTVGAAIVDEWETCSEESVIAARGRITNGAPGVRVPQLVLGGTPEGFGFGYRWTEQGQIPGMRVIRARTMDNPFVGAGYIKGVSAMMTEAEAREKLEGIRTPKEGRVYTRFSRTAHHKDAPHLTEAKGRIELWADFNVGLMCWAVVVVDKDKGTAHVVDEILGYGTDAIEQAEKARRYLAEKLLTTEDVVRRMRIPIVCDASAKNRSAAAPMAMVGQVTAEGFRAIYGNANPPVEDRVASVQGALSYGRLTFDTRRTPFITKCFETQGRDAAGDPEKNTRNPEEDMSAGADAVGYGVFVHWPGAAPRANQHIDSPKRLYAVRR